MHGESKFHADPFPQTCSSFHISNYHLQDFDCPFRDFTKEEIKVENKIMTRCSVFLVIHKTNSNNGTLSLWLIKVKEKEMGKGGEWALLSMTGDTNCAAFQEKQLYPPQINGIGQPYDRASRSSSRKVFFRNSRVYKNTRPVLQGVQWDTAPPSLNGGMTN